MPNKRKPVNSSFTAFAKKNKPLKERVDFLKKFAADRRTWVKLLGPALRAAPPMGVEPEVRTWAIKFSQLPFGYVLGSCGGYFYNKTQNKRKKLPLSELQKYSKNKEFFYTSTHFELILNNSPEAKKFKSAVERLKDKYKFLNVSGETELIIWMGFPSSHSLVTKQDGMIFRQQNLRFIKEFEKLVDRFVKKYGVRARI